MKTIYFFKAKSRMGLINKPIHQTEFNIGVEDGPEAVLSPDFLKQFFNYEISEFVFPKPENINLEQFNTTLALNLAAFKDFINHEILRFAQNDNNNRVQIVIGGDHSVTFSSLLAVLERIKNPQDLGIVHFDSHGDLNLSKYSPTGNFHGMYLRPFFSEFDILEVNNLILKKIPTKNLLIVGNLDLDQEEAEFIQKSSIQSISQLDLKQNWQKSIKQFYAFVNNFKHIHVSFDIDVFDSSIAPATGIPALNGLLKSDILPFLETIKDVNFSFDLCEVNPRKKGSQETIKLAQEVLRTVLG